MIQNYMFLGCYLFKNNSREKCNTNSVGRLRLRQSAEAAGEYKYSLTNPFLYHWFHGTTPELSPL